MPMDQSSRKSPMTHTIRALVARPVASAEPLRQPGVESTLLLLGAPSSEHLQHHEVIGALDTWPVSSQIS
jgi:hypothetical protein